MKAHYKQYDLPFKNPVKTSRGTLSHKETYILHLEKNGKKGMGECAIFRGLSMDDVPNYTTKLDWLCAHIHQDLPMLRDELKEFPSILFGLEQALLNLQHGEDLYFPSAFTDGKEGIKINGLIWMGEVDFMLKQIEEKLKQNFDCLKLKIGVAWKEERKILQQLRNTYPETDLEIRVDANGAFSFDQAKKVLEDLEKLNIHSIEQPIKKGNWEDMRKLCLQSPTPIALDEELINITTLDEKEKMLSFIQPQYIILKPALLGGFLATDHWIALADKLGIGWWITSALESNVGLSAIAQYTYTKMNKMPQGLGTGALFTHNFETRLNIKEDQLYMKSRW